MDIDQRWVADMGLPGPDAGKDGKHLLLPPDYKRAVPARGYYIHRASSNPADRQRAVAAGERRRGRRPRSA